MQYPAATVPFTPRPTADDRQKSGATRAGTPEPPDGQGDVHAPLRAVAREGIRRLIATGRLKPGDRLGQDFLSAELGVSRSPIREALRELEQQGLVISSPSRGCCVVDHSPEDLDEVVMVRAWLEGLAARLAADGMNRHDFCDLEALVDAMERAAQATPPDPAAIWEADGAFHAHIVRCSANRRLLRIWQSIDPLIWLLRMHTNYIQAASGQEHVVAEHRAVVVALRAGPDEAEAAAREHVVVGLRQRPRAWSLPQ